MSTAPRLVLASASPRRRELLALLGIAYEVAVSDVDEDALTLADPWAIAEALALAKARTVFDRLGDPNALVLGADTVVALPLDAGYAQLAKPRDAADARRILGELSGRTHNVITGVALAGAAGDLVHAETTKVSFRTLDPYEIAAYVATGEPMDKAGAYGCQGGARNFIASMEGSFTNVMGLPCEWVAEVLAERGYPVGPASLPRLEVWPAS